jgi:hypothetical protein
MSNSSAFVQPHLRCIPGRYEAQPNYPASDVHIRAGAKLKTTGASVPGLPPWSEEVTVAHVQSIVVPARML